MNYSKAVKNNILKKSESTETYDQLDWNDLPEYDSVMENDYKKINCGDDYNNNNTCRDNDNIDELLISIKNYAKSIISIIDRKKIDGSNSNRNCNITTNNNSQKNKKNYNGFIGNILFIILLFLLIHKFGFVDTLLILISLFFFMVFIVILMVDFKNPNNYIYSHNS